MPGKPTFSLAVIRAAAIARAADSSERATAAEIGMSYTAYRSFVRGAKPHQETRQRLVAWYTRLKSGGAGIVGEDVDVALTLLGQYVLEAATPALARVRMRTLLDSLLSGLPEETRRLVVPALVELLVARSVEIGKPV